jgi:hypothetical protein
MKDKVANWLMRRHVLVFLPLILLSLPLTVLFLGFVRLPLWDWEAILVCWLCAFVFTHEAALWLTKKAIYWFGWRVEKNPVTALFFRRGISVRGLSYGSAFVCFAVFPALFVYPGSGLGQAVAVSAFMAMVWGLSSTFDALNDLVMVLTVSYSLTKSSWGVPVRAVLPYPVEGRSRRNRRSA